MIESLLLVSSVCIDAFVASIAYGTNKIKIPITSALIISGIGSLILGISLFAGGFIKDFLPGKLPIILSFSILMILGIYRLFEGLFKNFIQQKSALDKPLKFKLFDMNFVLQVYADETKADFDKSKVLTPKESFYLATALSFDSLAVGFGSSLVGGGYIETILLCFIIGITVVLLGVFIGKKLLEKSNVNLSWLSGVILMILAINKLF
ncbi:sporulation membrane protein YtaF [Clostridium sp. SHJSY1]|uniref:sporulation membrane protein YtaF n=1 Tax=Clostridium sp. SHJSY1 TaxID=2942483 RepID=UPI002874EB3B|nr:sporulation membrane protein YtaF [Clostridium sp. SHJSY1]MDS0528160.1 sporulation membrane protein YtaF [Clostridium sp. SHJSY1]